MTIQTPTGPPIQTPTSPQSTREGIDSGVIRDARSRQRKQWFAGLAAAIAVSIAVGLVLVLGVGANGRSRSDTQASRAAVRVTSISPVEPLSIAVVNRDLYIADGGRHEILERSPDGRFSAVAGTTAAWDLVASGNGSLFFAQGHRVREITPGGVIRTVVGLHPSCASVPENATAMAAESAQIDDGSLSAGPNGRVWFSGMTPCPRAHDLGPFLRLTTRGELTDTELDTRLESSPLSSYLDGGCESATGSRFTAFLCASGERHPKELLVLRDNGTTEVYPTFGGGDVTSRAGEVIAVRDDTVVRVTSHGLQTIASGAALDRLVPGGSGAGVIGLALGNAGAVFMITDEYRHRGCTATISEISSSNHRERALWERRSSICY